jgi:adenylate cyclase|tara:strand:- start:296 stop:895 length:600 start_codon:yes stop_codon:yes gene_type:complete
MSPETTPARDAADSRPGSGTEHPDELRLLDDETSVHLSVERTFCFADLSGFTRLTEEKGPHESVEVLEEFRAMSRRVAAWRGVRVAKWLGDGVMLVGTEPTPTIAWAGHLIEHFAMARKINLRVGLATGEALLFEGDDYIGKPVNLAAKLCAVAKPGEILANCEVADLPPWIRVESVDDLEIRGAGTFGGIQRLAVVAH